MNLESFEHTKNVGVYPSEKIFTLQEIKEAAYKSFYETVVSLEIKKTQDGISSESFKKGLLEGSIYSFFGSLISEKPSSLGLPEKILLPGGEKSWKDIPLRKTGGGSVSIESIALGESQLLLSAPVLANLKKYWGLIGSIEHFMAREVGDISKIKTIRLLQDDNEPFRIRLKGDDKDNIATHGKRATNILRVEYTDGTEKLINLLDTYRVIASPKTGQERDTLARIQQERKELKESMNREPLFGGSLSYEYTLLAGSGIAGSVLGGIYIVKSIRYRDIEGKLVDIIPKISIQGTKEKIIGAISKEMESLGMVYNTKNLAWENIFNTSLKHIVSGLPEMSVSEMNARTGLSISSSRWDTIRKNPEQFLSKIPVSDLMKKGMKGILKHGILFPLDVLLASEVATYSNSATLFSASSDLTAFYLGQKSIDIVGKLVPGGVGKALKLLRFPAGIVATIYSNQLWKEALEGNKKKWQYLFQNGLLSVYTDGQSFSGNLIGGGFVNFALDTLQRNKKTGEQLHDIGTMAGVLGIFGKELDIPEVNFFQHKIDLATDPGDWLRGQPGRTVDDWNNQVSNHLPHHTLRLIRTFIEKMYQGKYPFTSEKLKELKITKEDLLIQTLNTVLSGGNDPSKGPVDVKGNILLSVEKELKSGWKGESSINRITEVVYTQVPKLKIDPFFMEHYYPRQILFHQTHIWLMFQELGKYIGKREFEYIQTIQGKMERNEPIADEGKWVKTEVLGMSSNKFIPSETNLLFQGILDNRKPIKAILDMNPKSKPIDTTVGEYFAYILNFILEQKRRKEFYKEVEKGNKSGVQWTL